MAMIDDSVRKMFEQHRAGNLKYVSLATASKDGVPNVVPVGMIWIGNDREIFVVDNYFNKTLANIKENPAASIYVVGDDKRCLQIKGGAKYCTAGSDYEEARDLAKSKNENFPAKGLLKIVVTDIYDTSSGPGAGNRYEPGE